MLRGFLLIAQPPLLEELEEEGKSGHAICLNSNKSTSSANRSPIFFASSCSGSFLWAIRICSQMAGSLGERVSG
jgi:hypothetical protein